MPATSGLMPTGPSRLSTAPRPDGRPEIALTRASVNALIRHLRGSGQPVESREQLDALLEVGHPAVAEWLDDAADALVAADPVRRAGARRGRPS